MFKGKSKSFGLIETVVAVGILTLVIASTTALGVSTIHGTSLSKHKTEAYFIAQDAMEQIKGQRDWVWQNWDKTGGITWSNFWTGNFPDPYSDKDFTSIQQALNGNCVYINHSNGDIKEQSCSLPISNTLRFIRNVTGSPASPGDSGLPVDSSYKVTVTVSWPEYGTDHSVVVSSYVTDWQPRY